MPTIRRFKDADGSAPDQVNICGSPVQTFTGEDVLEPQGHGGPVIPDLLLKRIPDHSRLRIARPGDSSERVSQ